MQISLTVVHLLIAASDGFGSNFCGAAFCLRHQLVGFLLLPEVRKTKYYRFMICLSSAADSISWLPILIQIVFHISAYLDLVKQQYIRFGEQIDIAIPCGTFSNALAAYYGKVLMCFST